MELLSTKIEDRIYKAQEALNIVKENANAKFDETIRTSTIEAVVGKNGEEVVDVSKRFFYAYSDRADYHSEEEQKQEWLPKLTSAEAIGCFGLTESQGGSDPANMYTTATPSGDGWHPEPCEALPRD